MSTKPNTKECVARAYPSHVLPSAIAPDLKFRANPDIGIPPFNREQRSGNYVPVWLLDEGDVLFGPRCGDFASALRLTRMHKRSPTWILNGSEQNLDTAEFCLRYRATAWLTIGLVDRAIRRLIRVVATQNMPEPSRYIQPKVVRVDPQANRDDESD